MICPFVAGTDPGEVRDGLAADRRREPAARLAVDRRSAGGPPAAEQSVKGAGHWPEVARAVLHLIRTHKSTLVFGNARQLVERLAARLEEEIAKEGDTANPPETPSAKLKTQNISIENQKSKIENLPRVPVILPHHGSIAKEVRLETEQALKRGELDAVLATSSLELGIDIGSLDLVVQIDSPGSVAAALQRVGRAGHLEKATAKGRFVARGLHELPAFGALLPLMETGEVEDTRVPENCLDVLAQQIVAACVPRPQKRGELFRIFRRAMPYRHLLEKQFDAVAAMLSRRSERVGSLGAGMGLRPRISFDRINDELTLMPGVAQVVLVNSGVISDTGQFPVYLIGTGSDRDAEARRPGDAANSTENQQSEIKNQKSPGVRLGELDEEFVYETKEGDRIILGSHTWRVVRIDADRVWVERAEAGTSRMPFWRGERAPRSEMLGEAVARFHGEMARRLHRNAKRKTRNSKQDDEEMRDWLMRAHKFDAQVAENAIYYYRRQLEKSAVPTESQIAIEHFVDRTGEPLIAILSPFGTRMNYALRLALESHFARRRLPAQLVHSDDGILIRPPAEVAGGGEVPENPLAWLKARTLESEIADQMESTALFGLRFRQNAARALMLPKMTLSQRTPLWQQRLRARHLLATVRQQRNFPIMIETYRECMQDVLAIPQAVALLEKIERGDVSARVVRQRELGVCSPFARSLFSQFTQAYLYEWDDPLSTGQIEPAVDQRVLDEILRRRGDGGDADTRENGDAGIQKAWSEADERALSRRITGTDYPARSAEELLEKIETAGAMGVDFGDAGDPRWVDWVLGGAEEAKRMLGELQNKRRLARVNLPSGKGKAELPRRWIAVDNLALLLAAMNAKRPRIAGMGWDEIPPAILHTDLSPDDARRIIAEQFFRSRALATQEEFLRDLSWRKEAPVILEEFRRAGKVLAIAGSANEPSNKSLWQILWADHADQLRAIALRRERRGAATVDIAALQRHLLNWQRILPPPADSADHPAHAIALTDAAEDTLDQLTGLSFPLEFWEHELFPARIAGFTPALLDELIIGGRWIWTGAPPNSVAFWPRHLIGQRPPPAIPPEEPSADARRVMDFLKQNGASFQLDLQIALSMDESELARALAEMSFFGRPGFISNDQLQSLREVLRLAALAEKAERRTAAAAASARPGRNGWRSGLRSGGRSASRARMLGGNLGGRWFVLPTLPPPSATDTSALERAQQAADRVERFLRRTGFACRELLEPDIDGTWKNAYDVLTRMEWAGTVRRGYFVDGIAGSQFALPGVRLDATDAATRGREGTGGHPRGEIAQIHQSPGWQSGASPPESAGPPGRNNRPGPDAVHWLSMLDPANIWARTATHWTTDAGADARIPRIAGSWLALIEGRPVLAAVAWGQRLIPLPASEEEHHRALATISALLPRFPRQAHPFFSVRFWGEKEILRTPAEEILHTQGFTRDSQGMRLYRSYAMQ